MANSCCDRVIRISTVPPWIDVEPEVAKFGGKLLHTSLSKEAEAKFQAMLDEANKSTWEALDPMAPGRPGGP